MTCSAHVSLLGHRTGQRKEEGRKGQGAGVGRQKTPDIETFQDEIPQELSIKSGGKTLFVIFGFIYFSFALLLFLVSLVYLLIILICMDVFTLFAVIITWK